MCYVKSLEQIFLFVQIGISYSQAIISMKLMEVYGVVQSYHEGR